MATATASRLTPSQRTALNAAAHNLSPGYIIRCIENNIGGGRYTAPLLGADLDAVKRWLKNFRPNRDPAKEAARKKAFDTRRTFARFVSTMTVEDIRTWLAKNTHLIFCPRPTAANNHQSCCESCLVSLYLRAHGFPDAGTAQSGSWIGKGADRVTVDNPPEITHLINRFDSKFCYDAPGDRVYAALFN